MRRREFIATVGGAATFWPLAGHGQPSKLPVIGLLGLGSAAAFTVPLEAFRQGLRAQGFVEGKNVVVKARWAGGDVAKLPALAAELVRLKPDVIVTSGGPPPARAAHDATRTIPIVASAAQASVANFARPGGNLTGAATQTAALNPKRLQLLHEAVPGAAIVGYLANPGNPAALEMATALNAAARSLGIRLMTFEARSASDFGGAFAAFAKAQAGALLVMPDPYLFTQHRAIIALAARYRLPAIYEWAEIAQDGGLMSYGDSLRALYRRVGDYAGRILKGAKPGNLPLDQPASIRLVINLKAARTIGFTFPREILAQADEVIE